ncbi:unnamed protein product [Timema podura]|uniref:Uncharacterized protein n=1 Tax=Timema podura TaxID=61482 RepID=A0ABN7NBU6_TIMPD|nr:unnamed protein product [Timema podura]
MVVHYLLLLLHGDCQFTENKRNVISVDAKKNLNTRRHLPLDKIGPFQSDIVKSEGDRCNLGHNYPCGTRIPRMSPHQQDLPMYRVFSAPAPRGLLESLQEMSL